MMRPLFPSSKTRSIWILSPKPKPDFNDPAYHDSVQVRLTQRFGDAALGNAMRDLMEDERILALVPEGAAIMGRKEPFVDISFLRYMAITVTFKNLADPAPPLGRKARLFFMSHFVFDKRLEADEDTMTEAMEAITDSIVELADGGYDHALH